MRKLILFFIAILFFIITPIAASTYLFYTTNTTDGIYYNIPRNQTWDTIYNRNNQSIYSLDQYADVRIYSDYQSDRWFDIGRIYLRFDSSSINDNENITGANISVYRRTSGYSFGDEGVGLVDWNPGVDIEEADWNDFGVDLFSPYKNLSVLGTTGWYFFPFENIGISNISKTGNSDFGFRLQRDITNAAPTWQSNAQNRFSIYMANYVTRTPILTVETDTTPPLQNTNISNLTSCNNSTIDFTQSTSSDYNHTKYYKDNVYQGLTSLTSIFFDSLSENTEYLISLSACDINQNCNTTMLNTTIKTSTCGQAPAAEFSANKTEICVNDFVNFTDESTYIPTTWLWSLDGITNSSQNFIHQFKTIGLFNVRLNASNSYGSDSELKSNYIKVNFCTICNFVNSSNVYIGNNSNSWSDSSLSGTFGVTISDYNETTGIGNISNWNCPFQYPITIPPPKVCNEWIRKHVHLI
jgi:PKD repeat protein